MLVVHWFCSSVTHFGARWTSRVSWKTWLLFIFWNIIIMSSYQDFEFPQILNPPLLQILAGKPRSLNHTRLALHANLSVPARLWAPRQRSHLRPHSCAGDFGRGIHHAGSWRLWCSPHQVPRGGRRESRERSRMEQRWDGVFRQAEVCGGELKATDTWEQSGGLIGYDDSKCAGVLCVNVCFSMPTICHGQVCPWQQKAAMKIFTTASMFRNSWFYRYFFPSS